jgi:hypothetical protein
MTEECDLCNEEAELIDGTFFKRMSSGGMVKLCDSCWDMIDRPRCALCGTADLPESEDRRHTIGEQKEDPRGGFVCNTCRNVLDWNH